MYGKMPLDNEAANLIDIRYSIKIFPLIFYSRMKIKIMLSYTLGNVGIVALAGKIALKVQ
jgi:hypothetical protein